MPTLLSKKLAAKMHQRQIDSLAKLASIDRLIDKASATVVERLIKVVTGDQSLGNKLLQLSAASQTLTVTLQATIGQELHKFADWAHRSSTWALIGVIPRPWLVALLPIEARVTVETYDPPRAGTLVGGYGGLKIVYEDMQIERDPFGVPVEPLSQVVLTDTEKDEVLEKILFPAPSAKEVSQIIARTGWEERFGALSKKITDNRALFSELVTGYSDGENLQQLSKRVEGLVDGIKSSAKRIARTEGMRVAERIQRRSWEPLGDIMTGAQVIAVLDERTRPEHATRNGQVYYKNPRAGQKSMSELPDLPDGPNCRCMSVPVLEPPEELKDDPQVREAFRTASGVAIPDPESYEQWFSQADPGRRKLAVGVARYDVVQRQLKDVRQPEWSDFVDVDGNLLTVAQLDSESALDRVARKENVQTAIRERAKKLKEVATRGFVFPKSAATQVPGVTFTGEIDPTDSDSMLGELIRSKISKANAKGPLGQKELSGIGSTIRKAIETPDVVALDRQLNLLQRESVKLLQANKPQTVELQNQIAATRDAISKIRQQRYLKIFRQIRDMGSDIAHPVTSSSSESAVRIVHESQRFFPKDWLNKMFSDGQITIKLGGGFYDHGGRLLTLSSSAGGLRSTAVHELIHRAERLVPGLKEAQKQLYLERTKGGKAKPLSWGQAGRAKRNRWLGHKQDGFGEYMGRDYGGEAYELATMSMEALVYGTFPIDKGVMDLVLGSLAAL